MTDAEYALWLDSTGAKRRWLFEVDYMWQSEGFVDPDIIYTPTSATLYMADAPYQSRPGDTPSSVAYVDCVRNAPSYVREIDKRTLCGSASTSLGSLEMDNPEGAIDFLLDLPVAGSAIRCYLGDESWARAEFRLMFAGTIERVDAPSEAKLTMNVRDGASLLDASIEGTFIGGAGPNAQRIKPITFGHCVNVECLQSNSNDLVYVYGHEGDVRAGTVRDAGLAIADQLTLAGDDATLVFSAGADTVTWAAHGYINEDIVSARTDSTFPAGLTEGDWFVRNKTTNTFQLSATRTGAVVDITNGTFTGTVTLKRWNYADHQDGTLTLGHPPFGIVTCDVINLITMFDRSAYFASDIISALVEDFSTVTNYTGNCTPDHFTIGDPDAFDADDGDYLIGVRAEEKNNLLNILDDVTQTALVFHGFNRSNEFVFGRINGAVVADSAMDFTADDLRGQVKVMRADPTYYSFNFIFNKNWKVQNQFLAAVSDEDVARFSGKGRYGSGVEQGIIAGDPPISDPYGNIPEQYHKTMVQGSEVETLLSAISSSDALNQGTAWFRLRRQMLFPFLEFIDITVGLRAYTLDLGNVVQLTYPRYGFDAGVKAQVIGIDFRPVRSEIALTLCRRRDADVSSGAHLV